MGVPPSSLAWGLHLLWGFSAFTFPLSATKRPCGCSAIGKPKHRSAVKLCPSRDALHLLLPLTARLHKECRGTEHTGERQPPSILTVAQHLIGAPCIRLELSPSGTGALAVLQAMPKIPPPLPPRGILPCHCTLLGLASSQGFSSHPHRGRSPGRQGHHVPLKAVGHSAFSHEQPRCAA